MSYYQTSSKSYSKRVIYKAWTAQNPDSVVASLTENTDLQSDDRTVRYDIATITNEWYKKDPEAAFDWLKNLDSNHKGRAISSIFSDLAKENMAEAKQKLTQLEGADYNEALEEIAEHWGETMNWNDISLQIASLPESSRKLAQEEALSRFSRYNPYEATEIISGLEIPDDKKYRYIKNVTDKIGKENPSATLDWALSNIEGIYQSRVADSVFVPWSRSSPHEAAEWLLTQPKDNASKRMYDRLKNNNNILDTLKQSLADRFSETKQN